MPFNIILGWHMYYTEQWMGGRGRMLIIAPLEVFYLFGGAIINIRPCPHMYYSLNNIYLLFGGAIINICPHPHMYYSLNNIYLLKNFTLFYVIF